jgi:hypothetical protein
MISVLLGTYRSERAAAVAFATVSFLLIFWIDASKRLSACLPVISYDTPLTSPDFSLVDSDAALWQKHWPWTWDFGRR